MPLRSSTPRTLEDILPALRAKLAAWQVRALFLGAQTSTNLRLGPQHLLGRIFGEEPHLGDSLDEVNSNMQILFGEWNLLARAHQDQGRVRLSEVPLSGPVTRAHLRALVDRRTDEIMWFLRGIDAGGDDPLEFGDEGQELFHKLAEASAFLEAYRGFLEEDGAEVEAAQLQGTEIQGTQSALDGLSAVIEDIMGQLMRRGADVRLAALREHDRMQGRQTNDGVPIRPTTKTGRNELCPCGSGQKFKRCCGGAGVPVH